ncbi:hypothetical protein [Ferruginibacter sp.]
MGNQIPANNLALITSNPKSCSGKCSATITHKSGNTYTVAFTITDVDFDLELDASFSKDDNNTSGSPINPHNADTTKIYGAFPNTGTANLIDPNTPIDLNFQVVTHGAIDVVYLNFQTRDIKSSGIKVRSGV